MSAARLQGRAKTGRTDALADASSGAASDPAAASPLQPRDLSWLWRCDRCPAVGRLFARGRDGAFLCCDCWHMAGHPWPGPGSITEIHEAEIATRRHMTDRGGKDRYLVANGKS